MAAVFAKKVIQHEKGKTKLKLKKYKKLQGDTKRNSEFVVIYFLLLFLLKPFYSKNKKKEQTYSEKISWRSSRNENGFSCRFEWSGRPVGLQMRTRWRRTPRRKKKRSGLDVPELDTRARPRSSKWFSPRWWPQPARSILLQTRELALRKEDKNCQLQPLSRLHF